MSTGDERAELAELLRPGEVGQRATPGPDVLARWVDACIARLGLVRPAPHDETADEDPRAFLWWLLRMAIPTYRRLFEPARPVDPGLRARLEALLADRPPEDAAHAQLHVEASSALRRAQVVREHLSQGTVLAVGDDDGVTLALALLGVPDVAAVDVDERLLEWLARAARKLGARIDLERVDVFDDPVPARFARSCAVVVTDPARSYEDCAAFLGFGAACLRDDGASRLLWADHPDWNFEHAEVTASLSSLGLGCAGVIEDVHAYPITPAWLPDPAAKARELSVDPEWLTRLLSRVSAWTHLYVLAPLR